MKPLVTRHGMLDIQVCVPKDFTDNEVTNFANSKSMCGTVDGWLIRREGDEALAGQPERNPCSDRAGCVHVTLDV